MSYTVKLFVLIIFFCMNWYMLEAQQKHFIYIQSENRQPFAIVMNGKVFSSSDYGYVIISSLQNGDYNFKVSFPMNKFPDQSFTCSINKKDAGYFLKNNTDGWALENIQTQQVIPTGTAKTTQNNAFGDMLSDVVSDSSLTKNTAEAPPANIETTAAAVAATASTTGTEATIKQPEKISELKADTGTNMLFVDNSQNGNDTINVFIPAEAATNTTTSDVNALRQDEAANITSDSLAAASFEDINPATNEDVLKKKKKKKDVEKSTDDVSNPFYQPGSNKTNNVTVTPTENANENKPAVNNNAAATSGVRPNCDNPLSDDDLNKLKRKMFSQRSEDDMVKYAAKYVSKKCISTDQVKTLGSLLSSDDGRYNLFDALYKYVYDYNNYPGLSSQILDPYYKKRFAAMLR